VSKGVNRKLSTRAHDTSQRRLLSKRVGSYVRSKIGVLNQKGNYCGSDAGKLLPVSFVPTVSTHISQVERGRIFRHVFWSSNVFLLQWCGCRGPGAGAEVTAGGVFSDLLRLAAYLGAPS